VSDQKYDDSEAEDVTASDRRLFVQRFETYLDRMGFE
jgi:hypothetical protein